MMFFDEKIRKTKEETETKPVGNVLQSCYSSSSLESLVFFQKYFVVRNHMLNLAAQWAAWNCNTSNVTSPACVAWWRLNEPPKVITQLLSLFHLDVQQDGGSMSRLRSPGFEKSSRLNTGFFHQCKHSHEPGCKFNHHVGVLPICEIGNNFLLPCAFQRDQNSVCSSNWSGWMTT